MSDLTLLVLRIAFLALLWAFVFAIVYALRSDLFGGRVRKLGPGQTVGAAAAAGAPPAVQSMPASPSAGPAADRDALTDVLSSGGGGSAASRLVITSGGKSGLEVPLGSEPLTIGRSSDSALQIRDDYTSTNHARLARWGDDWVIQDLDSTNGTFVDGARISAPTTVAIGTPVKVGATTFELRR